MNDKDTTSSVAPSQSQNKLRDAIFKELHPGHKEHDLGDHDPMTDLALKVACSCGVKLEVTIPEAQRTAAMAEEVARTKVAPPPAGPLELYFDPFRDEDGKEIELDPALLYQSNDGERTCGGMPNREELPSITEIASGATEQYGRGLMSELIPAIRSVEMATSYNAAFFNQTAPRDPFDEEREAVTKEIKSEPIGGIGAVSSRTGVNPFRSPKLGSSPPSAKEASGEVPKANKTHYACVTGPRLVPLVVILPSDAGDDT